MIEFLAGYDRYIGDWRLEMSIDSLRTLELMVVSFCLACALGMATPLALIRGGGMAAERGILIRSGEAFQILKDISRVILDKTGTVTRGSPRKSPAWYLLPSLRRPARL